MPAGLQYHDAESRLYRAVGALRLSVGLRVVSGGHGNLGPARDISVSQNPGVKR